MTWLSVTYICVTNDHGYVPHSFFIRFQNIFHTGASHEKRKEEEETTNIYLPDEYKHHIYTRSGDECFMIIMNPGTQLCLIVHLASSLHTMMYKDMV
jgi:hypothetical protein